MTFDNLVLKHVTFSHQMHAILQSSDSRAERSQDVLKCSNFREFKKKNDTMICLYEDLLQ